MGRFLLKRRNSNESVSGSKASKEEKSEESCLTRENDKKFQCPQKRPSTTRAGD
jgi:hypothetical protein